MNSNNDSKLNSMISNISKTEFFVEQISAAYINKTLGPNFLLEILSIFELGLLFYRIKKFVMSNTRRYLSLCKTHTQLFQKASEEKDDKDVFSYKNLKVTTSPDEASDLKRKIKALVSKIEGEKPTEGFNQKFAEELSRSGKVLGITTQLPINDENSLTERQLLIQQIAEGLHLIRPAIYCFSQLFFQQMSYKPYLISFFIDLSRLLLELKTGPWSLERFKEFKRRNIEIFLNYLLRNPFYTEIFRNRFLDPLLDRFFPNLPFLKKLIIYIIEVRSSLSVLM